MGTIDLWKTGYHGYHAVWHIKYTNWMLLLNKNAA